MSAKDDLWEFITSRQEWAWASADTANASLFGVVADAVRRFVATPLLAELFDSESPQGKAMWTRCTGWCTPSCRFAEMSTCSLESGLSTAW